jgi:hypothetical protein
LGSPSLFLGNTGVRGGYMYEFCTPNEVTVRKNRKRTPKNITGIQIKLKLYWG